MNFEMFSFVSANMSDDIKSCFTLELEMPWQYVLLRGTMCPLNDKNFKVSAKSALQETIA